MTSPALTPGLKNLRAQVNAAFPQRDKKSDGTIGDKAHQASTSGHNPDDTPGSKPEWEDADHVPDIRAWDMDSDLNAPPASAQQIVDHIRKLPNVSTVIRYMIYNRKIYQAKNGWVAEPYTGASAHTEHIHFSGQRTEAADQNTTFDFRLEEIPVSLTADDKKWITDTVTSAVNKAVNALGANVGSEVAQVPADLLAHAIGDKAVATRTVGDNERDFAKLRGTLVLAPDKEPANKLIEAGSPLDRMVRAADKILSD